MEKDVKKYSLYLIAIVAIVAVVGIVVMTTNYGGFSGFSGTTSEDVLTSDGEEESVGLAGQVYAKLGCTDPDGDFSPVSEQYKKKSTVTYKTESQTDACVNILKLKEYKCTTAIGGKMKITSTTFSCNKITGNYHCEDGACVPPKPVTCTPGLTGNKKCEQDQWTDWRYKEEYLNADCTLTWNFKEYCGYGKGKCVDNVGCCKNNLIKIECQGNTQFNQTKNSCTEEIKDNYKDCTTEMGDFGKSNICKQTSDGKVGCVIDCQIGEDVYNCQAINWVAETLSYHYIKYTCKQSSFNIIYWGTTFPSIGYPTCPSGATCYNPEGKCEGPKTT